MKRIIALTIVMLLPLSLFCQKEANVISKSGHWLTIDKGKKDDIEVGFKGIVKTFVVDGTKKVPLNIGIFKVEKVLEDKSELNVVEMGKGFNPEQAEIVVFQDNIPTPPPPKPKNVQTPVTPSDEKSKPIIIVPKGQPVEWYLEQGNINYIDKKFKEAREYYNKILEANPNDPVAQRKVKECLDNDSYYSYMKNGESCLLRSDTYSAIEYYLAAWKAMPSYVKEVLEKMLVASDASKADWDRFKEAKSNELEQCLNTSEKYIEKEDTGKRLAFYIIVNKIFPEKRKINSDKMLELSLDYKGNWKDFVKDYQEELQVYFDYSLKSLQDSNFELAVDYLFYAYRFLPNLREDVAKRAIAIAESQTGQWEKYRIKYQTELAEYLVDAKNFYKAGDIDSALRYYLYGYKFFPSRAEEISRVLVEITKNHPGKWQKFADENKVALKKYIEQGDEFLARNDLANALNYYFIAYQLLPAEEKTISDRFRKVFDQDKTLWEMFEKDKFEVLKPLLINQFYPFLVRIKDKSGNILRNQWGYWEATLFNGSEMIYIPEGEFAMGSDGQDPDIRPKHKVYQDGFWIGKYETTFEQYDAFCAAAKREKPDDKGWGRGKLPVINVSWFDAQEYVRWLSQETGLNFRLPFESEWEMAARGTSDDRIFPWGNIQPTDDKVNSSMDKKFKYTAPVGSFPNGASPFGLLEMAGNVNEWVMDWYNKDYYSKSPSANPQGPSTGDGRVFRGGGWNNESYLCRTCIRASKSPKSKSKEIGFRVSLDAKQ